MNDNVSTTATDVTLIPIKLNPPPLTITKIFEFDSAHKLCNDAFDESWNKEKFGLCYNMHGHHYWLHVTLKGVPNSDTGMVMNFVILKKIVKEHVVDILDHRNLNEFIKLTTCENMLIWIWNKLEPILKEKLYNLRLYETPTSYAEYFGGGCNASA